MRYAADWCIYGFPTSSDQVLSNPCIQTCDMLATTLETNILTPNTSSPYDYCQGGPTFLTNLSSCAFCQSLVPNRIYVSNCKPSTPSCNPSHVLTNTIRSLANPKSYLPISTLSIHHLPYLAPSNFHSPAPSILLKHQCEHLDHPRPLPWCKDCYRGHSPISDTPPTCSFRHILAPTVQILSLHRQQIPPATILPRRALGRCPNKSTSRRINAIRLHQHISRQPIILSIHQRRRSSPILLRAARIPIPTSPHPSTRKPTPAPQHRPMETLATKPLRSPTGAGRQRQRQEPGAGDTGNYAASASGKLEQKGQPKIRQGPNSHARQEAESLD